MGNGYCRTASNGAGKYKKLPYEGEAKCKESCLALGPECTAVEVVFGKRCELHQQDMIKVRRTSKAVCYSKVISVASGGYEVAFCMVGCRAL